MAQKSIVFRNILKKSVVITVAVNVLFWLLAGILLYFNYKPTLATETPLKTFVLILMPLLTYGLAAYIHMLWLIPRFLLHKRYTLYAICLVAAIAASCYAGYYFHLLLTPIIPEMRERVYAESFGPESLAFMTIVVAGFFGLAKIMSDAISTRRKMEELRKEKLESELQHLKSQINPHFLFNALNTIYGLSRRGAENSSEAILKLSTILRYVLYDCDTEKIDLEKEIDFLKNYLDFARLRTDENANISFHFSGTTDNQTVAPLLFIPLIENGFKHGINNHLEAPSLSIEIVVDQDKLKFQCTNTYSERNGRTENGNGVGLKNLHRRLELLYPEKHRLNVVIENGLYTVQLELELL